MCQLLSDSLSSNPLFYAQLWDAGPGPTFLFLQLLLIGCQQGGLERGCKAGGGRRDLLLFAGLVSITPGSPLLPLLQQCFTVAANLSRLQLPNTCRTGLIQPRSGTPASADECPSSGSDFQLYGNPISKFLNICVSVIATFSCCSPNPRGGSCPLHSVLHQTLVFLPLQFNTQLLILSVKFSGVVSVSWQDPDWYSGWH